uniref:SHSP domain-containing protein n=1 Tax=Strongyloides stercoralis TaxID=6248 RepID=A0A0K0ECL3_STRER
MASRWLTHFMRDPFFSSSLREARKLCDEFDRAFMFPPYWADKTLSEAHKFAEPSSEIINNEKEFKVKMDVSHFSPEELKVTVKDKCLQVEGRHEEKTDKFGTIQRSFVRRYILPPNVKEENVVSELNKEGILTIGGSKLAVEEDKVKNIPIEFK